MLTKKFIHYKSNGFLKKNKIPRTSMAYHLVNKIGVIFTIDTLEKHNVIKRFVKQLEKDGKKVDVLAFLPKKKENHEFLFEFFTDKDISFWGNITAEQVHKFANQSFDYLFYIDEESNPLIRQILAMSKAKCRVAKRDEANERFCEMMVHVPGSNQLPKLADEMYRYTKILS